MYFNFNEIMKLEQKFRDGKDEEASVSMIRAIGLQSLCELWRISMNYDNVIDARVNLQTDVINIAQTVYDLSVKEISELFDLPEVNVRNITGQ